MTPPRWTARSVIRDFPYRVILQTREVGLGGLMLDIGANTGRMAVPRAILGDVTAVIAPSPICSTISAWCGTSATII